MSEHTITRTGESFDTWNEVDDAMPTAAPLVPRLRLLYHSDLERVGAVTLPGSPLTDGAWQNVGRNEPVFLKSQPGAHSRPIEDPTVSRRQLRVRWRASQGVFEVEPVPSAKRRIGLISLEPGELPRDITSRCELPPGSYIAIENRVLLALEITRKYAGPEVDRLGFVGESEVLWQLRREISAIAAAPGPVLISGPTGAGKELVAQAIHRQSARSGQAFVVANCAALPEHLVESLLFGHKKGAFTGAVQDRDGLFRAAHRGSLFLDEMGELPIGVQPKLLRALQDGRVQPIGQHDTLFTDVRVLAATNRDLAERIRTGHLREDLYYRVACHVLQVPALAARRQDIPELFVHFLKREALSQHEHLWKHRTIPLTFFVDLMRCSWNGNVRELINVVRRTLRANTEPPFTPPIVDPEDALFLSTGEITPVRTQVVSPEKEPPLLREACESLSLLPSTVEKLLGSSIEGLRQASLEPGARCSGVAALLEVQAAGALRDLLAQHRYRQSVVASELEVSPNTLVKLMQQFGFRRAGELEAGEIEAALSEVGGNVSAASRHLEVSEQGLKRRIAVLELDG